MRKICNNKWSAACGLYLSLTYSATMIYSKMFVLATTSPYIALRQSNAFYKKKLHCKQAKTLPKSIWKWHFYLIDMQIYNKFKTKNMCITRFNLKIRIWIWVNCWYFFKNNIKLKMIHDVFLNCFIIWLKLPWQ